MRTPEAAVVIETHGVDAAPLVKALAERMLESRVVTEASGVPSIDELKTLRALVLLFDVGHVGAARARLTTVAPAVMDAGVSVVALVPETETERYGRIAADEAMGFSPRVDKETGKPVPDVWPRFIVESNATTAANVIAGMPSPRGVAPCGPLEQGFDVLLGRAFSDLPSIRVRSLPSDRQGKTSTVFRVDGECARGPLAPFLVKVTDRAKAALELESYVQHVADFVPFPVRPSLVSERCVFGWKHGALVQRFIEHENALGEVVLGAASPATLHNVFEHLLSGWWRAGTAASVGEGDRVLSRVRHWYDRSARPERQAALEEHAAKSAASPPAQLAARLDSLAPRPYKKGWIHGDLHADNIRVRGTDAFLIDFGSVGEGPLLADPAALEVSLVLKAGLLSAKGEDTYAAWLNFVKVRLYGRGWGGSVPARRDLASEVATLDRLGSALRTIRMHAMSIQTSDGEYAQLIAAALIRQASRSLNEGDDQFRCASALYAVADRIAEHLT